MSVIRKPTKEEIEKVFEWLEFREVKSLLAALLSKYTPTEVNLVATINAWGEELPPQLVRAELILLLSNLLPLYELLCQPEINN